MSFNSLERDCFVACVKHEWPVLTALTQHLFADCIWLPHAPVANPSACDDLDRRLKLL